MFTGIIEEVGELRRGGRARERMVRADGGERGVGGGRGGGSISVSGVCLTVTSFDGGSFTADVMPETYRKTNLSGLKAGDPVNLERAMAANGRFGGHIVQGHVDGIARIVEREQEENAVVFRFRPERADLMKYMLPGGSITVDGISLTLVDATESTFSVSIIPHTLAETALKFKRSGDTINVECDILGKYIERLLNFGAAGEGRPNAPLGSGRLTTSFLSDHGFM